jgi:hypothetical protein
MYCRDASDLSGLPRRGEDGEKARSRQIHNWDKYSRQHHEFILEQDQHNARLERKTGPPICEKHTHLIIKKSS